MGFICPWTENEGEYTVVHTATVLFEKASVTSPPSPGELENFGVGAVRHPLPFFRNDPTAVMWMNG